MEQHFSLFDILSIILFLGSITFLIGAVFQGVILYRNKRTFLFSALIIVLTRVLTVIGSYFIWAFWMLPIDIMFLVFFLPALIPELILSPLILKLTGNGIWTK